MMGGPRQRATAPATQTAEKKSGFFKRHLGRRRSSVSFPHQPTSPQQTQTQIQPPKPANPTIFIQSHDDLNKPESKDTDDTTLTKLNSYESYISGVDSIEAPRQGSKTGGVRWAGVPNDPPSQPLTQSFTRPRRTSSAGHSRRGSIYLRIEGLYSEGVDVGAGSKARRLSVALPDELRVDECPLSDHFSLLSRAGKKDIGEGGAAVVRLMQSKTAGSGRDKLFAVKEFREWEPDEEKEDEYARKIKSEFAIAKSCQNPNIVETFRLCYSDKKWFHVMEYCDLGDLNDIINKGYFSREDKSCMFKQLLRGVDYLHSRGIAHRDLKSENLLLSNTGCLKIADFGTAEVFSGTHPGVKGCRRPSLIPEDCEIRLCAPGMVGSRPYTAPEIIEHRDVYDPRGVDVWSCAIVFLTLCVGGTPWDCASKDVKNYNIFCNTWDAWLKKYPDGEIIMGRELPAFAGTRQFQLLEDIGTKTLVMGMLHPDPSKRWSASDVVESKPFIEYPCCQQEGYSDDIKTRQRKALHDHRPPKKTKSSKGVAVKPK